MKSRNNKSIKRKKQTMEKLTGRLFDAKADRYQQGDVNLFQIAALPEGLVRQDHNVLQEGEVTGHKHQFTQDSDVAVFCYPNAQLLSGQNSTTIHPGFKKFVQVNKPSKLVHEEHNTQVIMPGIYEMDLVREFDYQTMETRNVVD